MREPAEQIAARVCRRFAITPEAIFGRSQAWVVAKPRQRLMLEMFVVGYRMAAIGRFLGRDHSTVSLGIRAAIGSILRKEGAA